MSNILRHNVEGTLYRGPSPIIWGDLSKLQDDMYMGKCAFMFDDFLMPPSVDASAQAFIGGGERVIGYCDTGVAIRGPATDLTNLSEELGILEVTGNDADNDEGHIQFGTGSAFHISNAAGNTGKVMFEARVKTASIGDNGCSVFWGLGTGPVAADYMVDDTGALITTKGFIGFRTLAADGDILEFVFQAASQTLNTVFDAHTLVADDYVKLGFVYDPSEVDAAKQIKVYVNGAEQASYVSTTDIDAATFPEGEGLVPMQLTKVGTAAEVKVTADWVAAAQYMDTAAVN
jgi:hypothetical protein